MSEAETTPVNKQTTLELIFAELAEMRKLCQRSADNSFAASEAVKGLVSRVDRLEKQRIADHVYGYWAPLFISCAAFFGMMWFALRFGHG